MSRIDIRLLYQKHSGLSLDTIEVNIEEGTQEYIDWLEEQLEIALSVGEQLLISHNLLLGDEESYQNPGD